MSTSGSEPAATDIEEHIQQRECRDCGLFQALPALPIGASALCVRCGRTLRSRRRHGVALSFVCTTLAILLFGFVLQSRLMDLHALGRLSSGTVFTGPEWLGRDGRWQISLLVLVTLVVMPFVKLSVMLAALLAASVRRGFRLISWSFGWLDAISPWSMVEVFLVGAMVAYTRLDAIAKVDVGPALVAAGGMAIAMAGADAALDPEAVWERISRSGAERRPARRSGERRRVGCDACGLVTEAVGGERCERCHHRLGHRKKNSVARVWACVLSAAILYVPANLLPVMTITRFDRGGPRTILGGVIELMNDHMWPLALVVFLASVAIPLFKLGVLVAVLVTTELGSSKALRARTRLYKFVRAVGRWSMIDVFMLTVLVGLVHMGFIAEVLPDDGAMAFAAVVVLTMLATEMLDTRLMWDVATPRSGTDPHWDHERVTS
ncbi:MAG TPA: paraquat-inducible protein A [Polyangiaceae bacterium]|jgi:paraquat-inducible protein A|nr:paraquat-inducible protein A [Polyangiaceae bacterium]